MSVAVDGKLIADATGRNALYKIHVSLGKIVNSLSEKDRSENKSRKSSVAPSVVDEDRSLLPSEGDEAEPDKTALIKVEEEVEEGEEDDDTATVIAEEEPNPRRDSLVESLLSDDDVEMTG